MPGNSFGHIFKITTFGESHGKSIGVTIDGCPPMLDLTEEIVQELMDRRKPGGSKASTGRKEKDKANIVSGVFEGKTTGTPIMIFIENKDAKSRDYSEIKDIFRPGHGDITYQKKYGIRDYRGGGRSSGRETAGRVAAGSVAMQILKSENIEIISYTKEFAGIKAVQFNLNDISKNPFLCPDMEAFKLMDKEVVSAIKAGDSVGGVVEVIVKNVPSGLGEPVFDKLDADIAKAVMSIGAVKGVEIGNGFEATKLRGSQNNDEITPDGFTSNNAGGILAGISNGDDIIVRIAVKPIPSILIEQATVDIDNNQMKISTKGRHDISPIPRINVVCEAMISIVIADHILRQRTIS
ncbi:MAG: chorismate synthase [Desulfobacterales bacterium]|nr:chorismate synthase [Desulfobacterales bacterium]MCP4160132.1 chorismate synthase [Deltaproteobacteria bacterium]